MNIIRTDQLTSCSKEINNIFIFADFLSLNYANRHHHVFLTKKYTKLNQILLTTAMYIHSTWQNICKLGSKAFDKKKYWNVSNK